MRFNTHCHVFNLQSIFNESTAYIMRERMRDVTFLPNHVADKIMDKLREFLAHGGGFDSPGSDPGDFSIDSRDLVGRIREFVEALRLAMLKNMDLVTDDMVRQLDDTVIFTPLMMDILVAPQLGPKPGDVFEAQLEGVKRQILRYPGRILPFYAVNPYRYDFVNRAIHALEHDGFIGIKLYPSLGYTIDAPGMDGIMHYCNANDIPILMHCNHHGFRQNANTALYCDPNLWAPADGTDGYLDTYPELKICFGHFGGEENFTNAGGITPGSWTADILNLMSSYAGRVFADVAYHDAAYDPTPTTPSDTVRNYFNSLNVILANDDQKSQVLWGTDTWLLRMVCKELDFWGAFQPPNTITADDFKRMSETNARAFLGVNATTPKQNIRNYLQFMQDNAGWSHAQTMQWLANAAG
jgi:predicted TIM-barrel fold metal-dependent hydrolase